MIDIESLFNDQETRFWTHGKNVSKNWINIRCPYCNDKSQHLGINLTTGKCTCWKCGDKDYLLDLVQDIYSIDLVDARKLLRKYNTLAETVKVTRVKSARRDFHNIIPKIAVRELPPEHREYLSRRRFNPDGLVEQYNLYACTFLGKYKWRIIAPIILEGKIVNFVAISVVGAEPKAKNCPNNEAIIDRLDLLYNFDSITNRRALVVEGATDVWRMGPGCVGTLSTNFTTAQVRLLSKACDEVFIMFDSKKKDHNAPKQALSLANQLTGLIKNVEILDLKEGDPADLTDEEAMKIRREINL